MKHLISQAPKSYTGFKFSKPKVVKINGDKVCKVKWTGKAHNKTYQGYFFTAKKGNGLYSIKVHDIKPYSKKTMPKCNKIIQTFKIE